MRIIIIIIVIIGIIIAAFFLFRSEIGEEAVNTVNQATEAVTGIGALKTKEVADEKLAIAKAQELWRARSLAGEDLSDGPCLSEDLIPGWVADIAHQPRQAVDDQPENQCSAFREGKASHFVELDPQGNVIRTY